MKRFHLPHTFWGQVLLCSLVTALITFPHLMHVGLNGITRTYLVAAERFWAGSTPYAYPVPNTDWFKYSPAFAMLYGFFTIWPPVIHALLWAALNFVVYWMGVARWVPAYRDGRLLWFWLIAASMELDGSLRYQQVNALLTGMMLWGLADFREGKKLSSAGILSTATNFKLLPAPFALTLSLQKKSIPFLICGVCVAVFLFLLPASYLGWERNWLWHQEWYALLRKDSASGGLLDIQTVLNTFAPGNWAYWVRMGVGAITLFFLVDIRKQPLFPKAEPLWVCLGLSGILLFNLRTEPPTFVLAAPILPILWIASRALAGVEKKCVRTGIFACFFFLSLVHNDIWPKALLNPSSWYNIDKTLAVFGLWGLTLYLAWRKKS